MTNDLISRKAAIELFSTKPPEYYHTSYIMDELDRLPAIDAIAPGWISVKDREPPVDQAILVYESYELGPGSIFEVFYDVEYGKWYHVGADKEFFVPRNGTITHWMPLPEPPKEGRERCD